jgi:hypothetical protein
MRKKMRAPAMTRPTLNRAAVVVVCPMVPTAAALEPAVAARGVLSKMLPEGHVRVADPPDTRSILPGRFNRLHGTSGSVDSQRSDHGNHGFIPD